MKKDNIYLKSTVYLIIGGLITRLLGFIIRIIYTRIIHDEGVALLTIVMPTYSLLLTITSLALPVALSKLIAEKRKRSIKILSNATILILIINVFIIILVYSCSNFIAGTLLHAPEVNDLIRAMCFVFPIIAIGSILKGYFNGKQRTLPYMISNVLEQVIRLILMLIIIPVLYLKSVHLAVKGIILLSIITETISVIILLSFTPKHVKINLETLKPDIKTEKEILHIALPTVAGRIIGNIGYFLEPIILTSLLIYNGYSKDYILMEYGAYSMYAISILTIPSFLIAALSNSIVPEISKQLEMRNNRMVSRRIKQTIIPTFIIGVLFSVLIIFFRYDLLKLLYHTSKGANYILILAPFFSLFYLESILYSILQASNKARKGMYISLLGVIVKTMSLIILCFAKIGLHALVISEIINIIVVISFNIFIIKKENLL